MPTSDLVVKQPFTEIAVARNRCGAKPWKTRYWRRSTSGCWNEVKVKENVQNTPWHTPSQGVCLFLLLFLHQFNKADWSDETPTNKLISRFFGRHSKTLLSILHRIGEKSLAHNTWIVNEGNKSHEDKKIRLNKNESYEERQLRKKNVSNK